MLDHCDFHEQPSYRGRDSELLRPDLVVHLAGGRDIVVDAKVPMDAYLESIDAANEHDRDALEQQHAGKLRAHIRALSSRKYGTNIPRAVSLVVLFLPTEDLLRVSLERDPSLLEDAARHDIALATPSTLIALLRGVAYGWQEAALAEHAQHICELGATLHDRIAVVTDHLAKLGRSLDGSVRSFDETVGSVQSRLIPVARELSSAGVSTGREVSEVAQLHRTTRAVSAS
jgi:DNA recombination protein RmuC